MRITAKEEYGLRCILQLASAPPGESLNAAEIARREGLSCSYVEKLLWTLKKAGFTKSHRGVKGGYVLANPPEHVQRALGGLWTTKDICDRYTGQRRTCIHDKDCSLRPVWKGLTQYVVGVLDGIPISQILGKETLVELSLGKTFRPPAQV